MRAWGVVSLGVIALTGCGGADSDTSTVTVFAASSLTAAFERMTASFETANPDVEVVVSFAASSELARQITEGAPADVFASADTENMVEVVDAIVGEATTFATNRLQIITEPGNPLGITSLADLADPTVLFVTCDPDVPIGAYTADALAKAGVTVNPVSYEENVKGIVTKVTTGEADAGIVYATDVMAAGTSATGVDIADDVNVLAEYPIARVSSNEAASRFVDFVMSAAGRAVLKEFGFGVP